MPLPVPQLEVISAGVVGEGGEFPVSGFEVALDFCAECLLGVDDGDGWCAVTVEREDFAIYASWNMC